MKKLFLSVAAAALLVLSFGLSKASAYWCAWLTGDYNLLVLSFDLLKASTAKPAAGEENNSSQDHQVKIDNFSFGPATLTVPLGTTVTWTNQDDVPHTVVSTDGKDIKSPVLDTDQKFSYTFAKAGAYPYYCSIHPKMTGKVVVQ